MRQAIDNSHVVALDLPGNGSLCTQRSPATVDELADVCRAELQRRGVRPPFSMLALSLGAMVTVSWMVRHPEEVRGCVLINTSMRPFCPFYRRLRPANYPTLLRLALSADAAHCERLIMDMTSRRAAGAESTLKDWITYRTQHRVSRGNALRQLVAAARFRTSRATPTKPVLVLASTRDALVDVRCSRTLAQAWQCGFAEHPDAGHDLPLDDGPWVAEKISAWVAALS